jgi:SAM-dependent methyltransferase
MNRQLLSFARKYIGEIPEGSTVLDVGVGSAPYWHVRPDLEWRGLDVTSSDNTDYLITKNSSWPIQDNSFDVVLCTQVIEHVEDPAILVAEIKRVLKPGGRVILNAPFLYPFHGMPDDQARYTTTHLLYFFKGFEILKIGTLGGVGSSIATIYLNFVNYKISGNLLLQILKIFLLPIWLTGNALCNLSLIGLDKFDNTNSFPLNTYLIAKAPH